MTKKYGILAYPAKHSLSPAIHNAAFRELLIDAEYRVFEIPEPGLAEFMETVRHEPINGLSISLPHKEAVMIYLDEIDEDARKIGAVNTVVNRGGFLHGYNTDFIGSNMALREVVNLEGKKVVVIGAGGAARAVVYGVLKEGAVVSVYNRKEEKARVLAQELGAMFDVEIVSGGLEEVVGGDVLVQATSIWTLNPDMSEEEVEKFVSRDFVGKFDVVVDIVYKPFMTPLLEIAKSLGKTVITGEKMLLHQAVEQFELWTGEKAPIEVMRSVLENALVFP